VLISITGPECSGKTTLTNYLARNLDATPVLEFARAYLSDRDGVYGFHDLDVIARGQLRLVNEAGCSTPADSRDLTSLVITDTFLLVVRIWSMHKYNKISEEVKHLYTAYQPDVYVLCRPDMPWVKDALRENARDRDALFAEYLKHVKSSGIPFVIVEGEGEERMSRALEQVSTLIQKNIP